MKSRLFPIIVGFSLFCILFSAQTVHGQEIPSCGSLTDPALNYNPNLLIDPCCTSQTDTTVCYDLKTLIADYGDLDSFSIYKFSINSQNVVPPYSPYYVYTFDSLANLMNYYANLAGATTHFIFDSLEQTICSVVPSSYEFGLLMVTAHPCLIVLDALPCQTTEINPEISGGCPVSYPDFSGLFDPNGYNLPDTILMEGANFTLSTSDFVNAGSPPGVDGEPYTGPSGAEAGFLMYQLVQSGALEYGAGCSNLNCIDIAGMAAGLTTGPVADSIIAMGNADPSILSDLGLSNSSELPGYFSEAASNELNALMDTHGSFTGMVNFFLGLSIPDQGDCLEDPIEYSVNFQGGGAALKKSGKAGKKSMRGSGAPIPGEQADLDFFSQEIPGLGIDGGGPGQPSPSALKMIDQVNAGVNLYNGSQSLSIPLYNLKANDISVPISLSAGGNGLKVDDIGTLIGQQWNIDAGALISRVVRGLPDEFRGTSGGIGISRVPQITPRVQILSHAGLQVKPITGVPPCGWPDDTKSILDGFCKEVLDAQGLAVTFHWTPLNPTVVSFIISIEIIKFTAVSLWLDMGITVGFAINQTNGQVHFEEEGLGFMYLDNEQPMQAFGAAGALPEVPFPSVNPDDAEKILSLAHANRRLDDWEFFNDQITNWTQWKNAVWALFNSPPKYKTKKLDTEPDEFHFNVGGYSGKFSMNSNGEVLIFPAEDLDIEFDTLSVDGDCHIYQFVITTPEGMRYTFGKADLYGVDFTHDTSYYLPNYYTFPEIDNSREKFGKAQIDAGLLPFLPIFGPYRENLYGNTYERNYRIMEGPKYASAWHLIKIESLLSTEEVSLKYVKREGLTYYSNKSYNYTFPNFGVDGGNLVTNKNSDLNPIHPFSSKWENGRAEFSYSVTQTYLDRWDLTSIETGREEAVHFFYNQKRGEIYQDSLCSRIEVRRKGKIYKGWLLEYEIPDIPLIIPSCDSSQVLESGPPSVSMEGEDRFELGSRYEMGNFEFSTYFFFRFTASGFTIPIQIPIPRVLIPQEDWGGRTHMGSYGSLMEVKRLNGTYNANRETFIYHAEKLRTFLIHIRELDKDYVYIPIQDTLSQAEGVHEFVNVEYYGDPMVFPKRFSTSQDNFGYFVENSYTGSPFAPLDYTPITGAGNINSQTPGIDKLFGFRNLTSEEPYDDFHLGQSFQQDLPRLKTGSIRKITLATGGNISFEYGLNVLPNEEEGAGLRVIRMEEHPYDGDPKVTHYTYKGSTTINEPVRSFQHPENYYAHRLITSGLPAAQIFERFEQKVSLSSKPLNQVFVNKSSHVGYATVMESWGQDAGMIQHFFTTPDNLLEILPDASSNSGAPPPSSKIHWKACGAGTSTCSDFSTPPLGNSGIVPPQLEFPDSNTFQPILLGLEYKTVFWDAGASVRRRVLNEYEVYSDSARGTLKFFKSEMYQTNNRGSFVNNFLFRSLMQIKPFGKEENIDLIYYILDLIIGTVDPHPLKRVSRFYEIRDYRLEPLNIRLKSSVDTSYYDNGLSQWVKTENDYVGSPSFSIPKNSQTTYSDGMLTRNENLFVTQAQAPELAWFSQAARTYLNSIGYTRPVGSKSYLGTNLTGLSLTALDRDANGIIIPSSNWTVREGQIYLAGRFMSHNEDGKPLTYYLAYHGSDLNSPVDHTAFFEGIKLDWNPRLQLTKRSYQEFSTYYTYNNYFELTEVLDPDKIKTTYSYDPRGRLQSSTTLNGNQTTTYDYTIAPGNNTIQTNVSFADGVFPNQVTTQKTDGFGKTLSVVRNNDGAALQSFDYDQFFRTISEYNIGSGSVVTTYDDYPVVRKTTQIDAVGNVTETEIDAHSVYFQETRMKDPNGYTSFSYTDGLQRTRQTKSPQPIGSTTTYLYDGFGRLTTIINPIDEVFQFQYNSMDKLIYKKVPGAGGVQIWWDNQFRPMGVTDGNGSFQIMSHDEYNRVDSIFLAAPNTLPSEAADAVYPAGTFDTYRDEMLMATFFTPFHTWVDSIAERILTPYGLGGWKKTYNKTPDDIGRPQIIEQHYPHGKVITTPAYTDANLINKQLVTIDAAANPGVDAYYEFAFDEVLRPTETRLKVNSSQLETISKLEYTPYDQVEVKWLGEKLQKIDYLYDAAGRLTHINTIGESECYRDVAFCQYSLAFSVFENDSTVIWTCRYAWGIEINGLSYPFPNALDLLNPDSISRFEAYLADALDTSGYQGEVSLISFPFSGGYSFHIVITSSDAPDLALNFQFCGLQYDFVQEDCCEKNAPPPPAGVAAGLLPHNDDLFYEEITYNKLDISRIEIGSDCSLGYMRNDFSYDENHRVIGMRNTFFNPDPIAGRYNTSYQYDAAGNITRLNRYGLIDASAGQYTYGLIDSLVYTYANGDSRLSAIEDFVPDPLAEPKGFEIAGAFGYDGNGNFTSDGDQGLAIASNLINLPRIVASPSDSLLFEYAFGGEKIRKLQTSPVARDRIYLGGAEFVNDTLELYHHAEGRVVWRDTTPAFQYRIADHLGNTVVFFEDRDGDTYIKTESMTSDPDSLEVLQRNYYYPFGMEMEGPWQAATAPRADYLYNGKEFNEDLGLEWYAYGFRYYDPAIGRFTGVDPIADQFPELSVYNYASNDPIKNIDLHGLQGVENNSARQKESEAFFFITKPRSALAIGVYKEGGNNISTYAGNFAINAVKGTGMSTGEGSQRNAIRHGIWQAIITRDFGQDVAEEAGNAHEGLVMPKVEIKKGEFTSPSSADADSWADLLNNDIGQKIGKENPNATNVGIAKLVIKEFKENGMWTVTETDSDFIISRTKLTNEEYEQAIGNVQPLRENGLREEKKEE